VILIKRILFKKRVLLKINIEDQGPYIRTIGSSFRPFELRQLARELGR